VRKQQGFTVIEIIVVIVFLGAATVLLFMQKNSLAVSQRDDQRKVAINAMYYSLEEVFYEKNGYYPPKIDSKVLRSVDPDLFTDPNGVKMGDTDSDYRYDGQSCNADQCKAYTLRANLEREDDYVKTNRNK
jgi:type II secretory pathway pseudopilin PulG